MDKIINKIFKRKDNKLNQYPCNVYLQNALRFIAEKEYDTAYTEICWAIIKSGGNLTEEQEKIFKKINSEVFLVKENSRERDIHLLESYAGMTHKMTDNQGRPKLDQAIEHILSDYKRVLKENEQLRTEMNSL